MITSIHCTNSRLYQEICGRVREQASARPVSVLAGAAHYFAVAISHIVIIRGPPLAATAFAGRDQNKLIQRTRHNRQQDGTDFACAMLFQ
jgi:hypothetical protein